MMCPDCNVSMVHWSDSGWAQYGWGCPSCKMFFTALNPGESDPKVVATCPLDMVRLPCGYERVPAYARMVGLNRG